jgi:hypothetical protein
MPGVAIVRSRRSLLTVAFVAMRSVFVPTLRINSLGVAVYGSLFCLLRRRGRMAMVMSRLRWISIGRVSVCRMVFV